MPPHPHEWRDPNLSPRPYLISHEEVERNLDWALRPERDVRWRDVVYAGVGLMVMAGVGWAIFFLLF